MVAAYPLQQQQNPNQLFQSNTSTVTNRLFSAAIDFAGAGMNVLPIAHGAKSPAAGHPLTAHARLRLHPADFARVFGDEDKPPPRANLAAWLGDTRTGKYHAVIDADSPARWKLAQAVWAQAGIPFYAVNSARGGHLHFFTDVQIEPRQHDGIELRTSGLILLPPSVHPTIVFYDFARRDDVRPPTLTVEQVNGVLEALDIEPTRGKHRGGGGGQRMTLRARVYIGDAPETAEYKRGRNVAEGERNNSLYHTARQMHDAGFAYATIIDRAGSEAVASGLKPAAVHATIASACKHEPADKPTSAADDLRQQVASAALAHAKTAQWGSGRRAGTRRRFFEALAERARAGGYADASGRLIFRATAREIAELARGSHKTAIALVHEFERDGLLIAAGVDASSGGRLFQFGDAVVKGLCVSTPLNATNERSSGVQTHTKNDALEAGAIGYTGWRVYTALLASPTPLAAREIAQQAGLTVHQVRYALNSNRALRQFGLIAYNDDYTYSAYSATADDLLEIAVKTGKAGKAEARRARHQRERSRRLADVLVTLYNPPAPAPAAPEPEPEPEPAPALALRAQPILRRNSYRENTRPPAENAHIEIGEQLTLLPLETAQIALQRERKAKLK